MQPTIDERDEETADVPKPVLNLLRRVDDHHVDGHNTLRDDLEELQRVIEKVQRTLAAQGTELTKVSNRPVEVSALRFTPSMVGALILICASIIGGQQLATSGLADQQAATAAAVEIMNVKHDAAVKLQDERMTTFQRELTRLGGQSTMIDTKINNLRESMFTRGK